MDSIVKQVEIKEPISQAVEDLRKNYSPQKFTPSLEEFRSIYGMLEIWGKDSEAQEIKDKVKFVWDSLKSQGDPSDLLLSIFTELGITPLGDTKLNRAYRYIRLKMEGEKLEKHKELIDKELKGLKTGG